MFYTDFFTEGWVYFYKVALTVIGKCKEQLLKNDISEALLDVTKIRLGGRALGNLLLLGVTKKGAIWKEILVEARKCAARPEVFEALWRDYDPGLGRFEPHPDLAAVSSAFLMP